MRASLAAGDASHRAASYAAAATSASSRAAEAAQRCFILFFTLSFPVSFVQVAAAHNQSMQIHVPFSLHPHRISGMATFRFYLTTPQLLLHASYIQFI